MIVSELRRFDDDPSPVAQAVRQAAEHYHKQGDLDAADELLDAHLPYGTVAYFSQLTKNGRARAAAATSYAELERVEDFHEEIHDYLRWHSRQNTCRSNEADRHWTGYARGQAQLNDGDIFWPIAKALCRIEGVDASLDYIESTSHTEHDPHVSAIALSAVYRTAFERRITMPARAKTAAITILDQLNTDPISIELDQRVLLGHGCDRPMRFPLGSIIEPERMPYAETLWELQ